MGSFDFSSLGWFFQKCPWILFFFLFSGLALFGLFPSFSFFFFSFFPQLIFFFLAPWISFLPLLFLQRFFSLTVQGWRQQRSGEHGAGQRRRAGMRPGRGG
jgi:hypothetical protein